MERLSTWRPLANIDVVKRRARLYAQIRQFMSARNILEVDTPILSRYGISDPFIDSIQASASLAEKSPFYLHTSPEFCMKRLLAAGYGDIYQIAHVFRKGEQGQRHTAEFCMLEWYRIGFDYHRLMDELVELLSFLGLEKPERRRYAEVFQDVLQINPIEATTDVLIQLARKAGWENATEDRHELLDFIFSEAVIKKIKNQKSLIIYDYPACMAALAKLSSSNPGFSERFELFINGMEIANGFSELTDASEQRQRFLADLENRQKNQAHRPPLDENFLAALDAGLPESAGIAVGLDRLLMVLTGSDNINDTNTFTLSNN